MFCQVLGGDEVADVSLGNVVCLPVEELTGSAEGDNLGVLAGEVECVKGEGATRLPVDTEVGLVKTLL